jgi:hypothetical protein
MSVDHPNPGTHLLELDSPECFGQYIAQLIISPDLLDFDLPLLSTLLPGDI